MKKLFVILVAAVGLLAFAGSAMALTAAHQAAATFAKEGDCSGCHIPHKAKGAQRLFPLQPGAASITSFGYMGAMCAEYCHFNVGAVPNANVAQTALKTPGAAGGSHGLTIIRIPPGNALPATLPYLTGAGVKDSLGSNTAFECTTCHNTHKDATAGENDLLQMDIDAICDECHTGRGAGDVAWASGYGNHGAAAPNAGPASNINNPNALGSHPVGTDVLGDTSQHDWDGNGAPRTDSPIFIGLATAAGSTVFDIPYGAAAAHNLGGHLIGGLDKTGVTGVTCVTCHAVHGNQNDADPPGAVAGPYEDLLVQNQGAHALAGMGDAQGSGDGNGQATNVLCNNCHANTAVAGDAWNPGASLFSHPCDNQLAQLDMGAIAAPANWPVGSHAAVPLMSIGVICETCHDPHQATANTHILRDTEMNICGRCHTLALGLAGHHPVGAGLLGGRYVDAAIGDQDADMECSDCHNGSGAHNWTTAGGIGLDPDWEPFDNGRNVEPADGAAKVVPNTSKECFDCHTNSNNHPSPTLATGAAAPDMLEVRGEGTHYVGTFLAANTNLANGRLYSGAFNAYTGDYNPNAGGVLQARFGGAAVGSNTANVEVVCESCHELEISRFAGLAAYPNANLLWDYVEGSDTTNSEECESCHGLTPGGNGTHPLTLSTVSKAVDAGRNPVTLVTTAPASYANAAGTPNSAEYPATANRLNCDSCHQPHDAPTNSGTLVLEYYDNTVAGQAFMAANVFGGAYDVANKAQSATQVPYQTLCTQCHAY